MIRAVKYEKSCGIVVLNNNKILLLHYPSGHWDFPKGHVDGNETEQETAVRELVEETAIDDIHLVRGFATPQPTTTDATGTSIRKRLFIS